MQNDERNSNRESLFDMARAYARGKALCAAVRLGIPDALEKGEQSLIELATAVASDPNALYRLLRALVSIGVVDEPVPGRFALTPFGEPLRRNAPDSVRASVIFWADLLADAWTYLPDCIQAGGPSGAASAMQRDGVRSRWSLEPDATAIFHAVFAEPNATDMARYAAAYDFSACEIVADLGGAGGGLLAAILTANPRLNGMLVDRQEAVDRAAARMQSAGLSDRCRLIVADLLESVPPGANVCILKNVLHGYEDDKARALLRNVRSAMPPKGRLLIVEVVLPAKITRDNPLVEEMVMNDLNMLAVTGGRERSEPEWAALLDSAGLTLLRVIPVRDTIHSIIEAAITTDLRPQTEPRP